MPKEVKDSNNNLNINQAKIEKQIIKNIKENIKDEIKEEIKPELKEEAKLELKEEIKPELKEDVMEDLLLIIDNETKNKLDKVEHKIIHHKNMSIFRKIIIIIILLLLVIYETKLLYDNNLIPYFQNKNNNTEDSNNLKTEATTKESNYPTKDWYLENYSYLIDNIKTNLSEDNNNYLYKSDYKELTIKNSVRLNMAYQLLDENSTQEENNVIIVSSEKLKEAYTKLFGTDINYKEDNFTNNCINFIYNKENNNFMAINTYCEESKTELKKYIDNIYEEDGNLIMEVAVGIYNKENNTLSKIDGTEVSDSFNEESSIEDYKELLNTYKYTFKNIDNEYYFSSIEKVLTTD